MTALDLLDEFRVHHVRVVVDGDRLVLDGPVETLTDELIERARALKPALLEALTAPAVTDTQVEAEARYGRVCCLRCAWLTARGLCRALSTSETQYLPLEYQPVILWRRCNQYRARTEVAVNGGPGR